MQLKNICDVFSGYAFKSFNTEKEGTPIIKIGNINNDGTIDLHNCQYSTEEPNKKYKSKNGDIYIALSGATTGKIGLMKSDNYYINQRVGIVRIKDLKVPVDYLLFFLQSKTKKILSDAAGAAQPNISPKDIAKYEISIPSEEKMISISKELNLISRTIVLKQNKLLSLDELIKSRFIEMFGDRLINLNKKMSSIATPVIGLTYKPSNVTKDGTIVLRSGNIQNNELQLKEDIVRVSNINISEQKWIKDKDILMCSRNGSARLVGKSCLIRHPEEQMSFGAFMTVVRTKYPYFLQGFFTSDYFKNQLTGVGTASVNQITSGMLNNYDVIEPTEVEEKDFESYVKQIDKSKFVCYSKYFLWLNFTFVSSTIAYSNVVSILE
jgi:type I restriction enzyme S subunit